MRRTDLHNQQGGAVIEVLISLGMAVILVTSIGKVLASSHASDTTSRLREEAVAYARESLEIISDMKNDAFACHCTTDGGPDACAGTTCTRTSGDSQQCTLSSGYTSCWTKFAESLTQLSPLHLELIGGAWTLREGEEPLTTQPLFTRVITIENLMRDANGEIVEAGGTKDYQTKKATVSVSWDQNGNTHSVELSALLTAWQNL
ncbi:MAG: hypothetical protein A2898_03640 [Candidatus Kerfeldbacteria bacterium RIFCSPLOWO2_01_FULL_48_11]|uniref:Uncharacterized protein n=1 Tax=Candidatus Kerfeldbacteria bacterium RIFCSPLOWO2_01_FULL_48_11 TaxID=1798543 RepID=A0A1G2B630_9BACT|nr:MAG: hypothetical protein UY52_C0019G0004 [Parcubacteria group bacterium GW2011_GWC2_49_9]OGY84602.1 MAG: hypothetical protein A2898_03640 [Candidatus Kerfeldbacteria bacterium RIFCSPLOWO2_01_FULL_48_11]